MYVDMSNFAIINFAFFVYSSKIGIITYAIVSEFTVEC